MKTAKGAKETYMVFRNGKWTTCESNLSDLTRPQKWEYTSAYGTAKAKGYSEEKANVLAEMYVFKQKFSDLVYSSELEAEYRKLFF